MVVGKEEEKVLERLSEEEALHLVPEVGVGGVHNVVDGGIASSFQSRVPVEGLWVVGRRGRREVSK